MNSNPQDKAHAAESPAVKSLEQEKSDKARVDKRGSLTEAVEETFPASDPVSASNPTKPGAPEDE
ncbi:hypothetical protein [Tianweitania sediminis]|uniref:Uncharacterized protein n=1 Tax=Tianweitania sediminis TaxID=1502156 RepID=A0A8J7R0N2_9HYPH|nr:hypothetical protein [Tianweitania sediminis]MBP0439775.1 hypothetical protein [Tianweitania sediminis]HEV7418050.1 hypothetical protein [Tianweitania sediminis]